jgi:hypothetical protein
MLGGAGPESLSAATLQSWAQDSSRWPWGCWPLPVLSSWILALVTTSALASLPCRRQGLVWAVGPGPALVLGATEDLAPLQCG